MSRGFGTTYGAGSNDRFLGASMVRAAKFSVAFWIYKGTGGASFQYMVSVATHNSAPPFAEFAIYVDNTAPTALAFTVRWSTQSGFWSATIPATKAWAHVMAVYDGSSVANIPAIYINGVYSTSLTAQQPIGTITAVTNNFTVSGFNGGVDNFLDGMVAHAAFWNGTLLTVGDAVAMASGVPPSIAHPEGLTTYLPLTGYNLPEPDIINGNAAGNTGTRLGISDPPARSLAQSYLTPNDSALTVFTIIAATIAAAQTADNGAINATEVMAASIAAFQQADFGALSLTQVIAAALQAFQQNNFAQISAAEVITSTIAAWQQSDYASLTIVQVITASLAAAQQSDFATLSADVAIATAINAYQGPDSGSINATEVIAAVIAAKQVSNFALLSDQEIITAMINAFQALDFGRITVPINVDRAKVALSATQLYSAAINQAALYTARTTAQSLYGVQIGAAL